jgi:hypothetical protein
VQEKRLRAQRNSGEFEPFPFSEVRAFQLYVLRKGESEPESGQSRKGGGNILEPEEVKEQDWRGASRFLGS